MKQGKVVAVILAGGSGGRVGMPKALLKYEGDKSFLAQLASVMRKGGASVLCVAGAEAEKVKGQHPRLAFVDNPAWQDGQLSSAKAGLEAALEDGADAVLLHPVDMPHLRASTVKSLVSGLNGSDAVVPAFENATGHPLLLSRSAAEKVLAMKDVVSMEAALQKLKVEKVAVKDPAVLLGINSPEDYERLIGGKVEAAPPPKKRGKANEASDEA